MATGLRRVGVLSDNASLVVALSLQGQGLDVSRVTDPAHLVDHDVALIEVPPSGNVVTVMEQVPDGVDCVVIGREATPGVRLVKAPYSMSELLAALWGPVPEATVPTVPTASPVTVPRRAPNNDMADAPAPSARRRRARVGGSRSVATGASADSGETQLDDVALPDVGKRASASPREASDGMGPDDPIGRVEGVALELRSLLEDAPFLLTTRRFGAGVAATLATELSADSVALWRRVGDEMECLAAFGLTENEQRLRPHVRQPLFEEAREAGGLIIEHADTGHPLMLGIPAAGRTPVYAVVVSREDTPVDVVTVGADALPGETIAVVEAFLGETAPGWNASQAVEALSDLDALI